MSKRTHSISCFLTFSTANSTTRHFATSLIEPITLFRRWLLYRRCFRSMRAFIESFEIRWKCAPSLGFRLQVACNRRPLDQSGSTTNQNTPLNLVKAYMRQRDDVNNVMKGKLDPRVYNLCLTVRCGCASASSTSSNSSSSSTSSTSIFSSSSSSTSSSPSSGNRGSWLLSAEA
jgi:uncharacterized membrane protein YgcG